MAPPIPLQANKMAVMYIKQVEKIYSSRWHLLNNFISLWNAN